MLTHVEAQHQHLLAARGLDRLWFWWCIDLPMPHSPLQLQPLTDDPEMNALQQRIRTLPVPDGAEICTGTATVLLDGTVRLRSPTASAAVLLQLQGWVRRHGMRWPGLCRLRGARLEKTAADGRVVKRLQNTALWAGIPNQGTPQTLAAAAATLRDLKPGQRALLWATAQGPLGRPFAIIHPLSAATRQADVAAFTAQVMWTLKRCQPDTDFGQGLLSAHRDHLRLQSRETGWPARLAAVVETHEALWPSLARLKSTVVEEA